ncbi:MAG: peptidoglycan DD-metalloendopeptidase family protein [Candidatus Thiodiazotropha sp. (ex Myrtea spinifera)]|nr:peptidoglycan DD-metalloendopeptidase family protein [Candidatus Thiodiazotropha sp. (ex Myrtea spinifera)]MCU7828630.1 peptidoglycan DD-metalloendopeptidase family protein [Candidatus Thiodiazotropha sp. (ex Myrtea sp. 'scaly one' KF741663)]
MRQGLLALLLTVWLMPPCLAADEPDLDAKTQQLNQVKSRIKSLHQQLVSTESQRDKQSLVLQETEKKIGQIARRIRTTGQSLRRQQRQLADLEAERGDARLNLDKHQSTLERQIRAAYAMGRQEKVKILLNQQDPAVVSRVMVYYDYFNEARIEQMGIIEESLKALNKIEREISREELRLQQLQAKNKNERQQLEAAQKGRQQIIASLDRELKDKGNELNNLKQDENQLQSLISNIQEALSDLPLDPAAHKPFLTRKGKLPWPSRGRLVASFGTQREVGKLKWDGVMIAAPEGREVRAIHHGRVAFADWLRGFGLLLIIDHGDGYMSLYGHNQSLFKETGEWVEPGEVVAQVGSSGGRTTSGVYFGIRHNGAPQNPKKWCKRISGRRVSLWEGALPGTLAIIPGSQQHREHEFDQVDVKDSIS